MHFVSRKLFCALGLSLVSGTASAVTLDWDAVAWTSGSLSNSYDVDPTKTGNDITVTLAPSGPLGSVTAIRDTSMQGGLGSAQNTLTLSNDLLQSVSVTVTFSSAYTQGVNNVSFSLFDVDYSNVLLGLVFTDQIRSITALSIDGVTQIAPTITGSVNNTVTGTGLNQVINGTATTPDTGTGSGNSNATISFATNAIKSFTFTFNSGLVLASDPTQQKIALHDISFTPVPELNPAWSALVSCIAVSGLVLRHRSLVRKK